MTVWTHEKIIQEVKVTQTQTHTQTHTDTQCDLRCQHDTLQTFQIFNNTHTHTHPRTHTQCNLHCLNDKAHTFEIHFNTHTHTRTYTHTQTVTPCPESTECVHRKHPDLCKSLGSTTCRFTRRSSLVHQCVVPVLVVLPMLRLRWALLNNPSCLMHRLDNRHCPSPCGPWSAVESRSIVFFGGNFFASHG